MIIVYAHPNKEGHCGHILQTAHHILREKNIPVTTIDLYQETYNPVLQQEEHYASGHRHISEISKNIQEKIKEEKHLMFIYPTWWQNMPAILKGFCDKIFLPHFGYYYKNGRPIKMFTDKKALIITSASSPRIITYLMSKDSAVKNLAKNVLEFCGMKTKSFIIGSSTKLTEKQKSKIEISVKKGLAFLL